MKLSSEGRFSAAVRLAILAGMAGGAQGMAHADDAAPKSGPAKLEAVTVTGSRIKQENLTSNSAITVLNDEELTLSGTVNVESLINTLPQSFAGFGSNDSNGATGTATVDLRGLGPARTMVLIDGKRLMPGDALQSPPSADLNFIPAPLVDSIDILTGGASAVYGADAIAGVVNFKMKRDFEGFRLDSQYSETTHHDGLTREYYALWGANSADGKGNVTMYAGYTKANAITQDRRKFSACSITTPGSGKTHKCAGSGTIAEGRIYSYDRAYSADPTVSASPYAIVNPDGTRSFIPDDGRTFNFAPYNYFQRPDERYHLGGFAHKEFNEHLDLYGSAMFMDNHTVSAVAPSGLFFVNASVPCVSPLLSDSQKQFLCGDVGKSTAAGSTDVANILVAKRAVEVGPRLDDLRHTDYRINLGAKGDIISGIDYDVSLQHGEVIFAGANLNYINTANAKAALNTTVDGSGKPVCAGNAPKGCVPLDIFQLGAITPAQVAFISAAGYEQANLTQDIATGAVTADLGKFGVKLPSAAHGVAIALGAEHRADYLNYRPDDNVRTGNLGGFGGPRPAVKGKIDADELFGELRLPILDNVQGAKHLLISGAGRITDYSTSGSVKTYTGGLEYSPTDDVALRASYSRAIRAASVTEAFAPAALGLFSGSDPCSGTALRAAGANAPSKAQCANTGVTSVQYDNGINNTNGGGIADCSSGQCNGLFGGNPALKPEEATTKTVGVVITPSAVKNLSITLDYFNIDVEGAITTVGAAVTLQQCLVTGNPQFCSNVHRSPNGRLSGDSSNANVGFISDVNTNIGGSKTRGVDAEVAYNVKLTDIGRLYLDYSATYLQSLSTNTGPGLGSYECAGLYGITCGTPNPTYRHKVRTTLSLPVGVSVSLGWRYFGSAVLDKNSTNPSLKSGSPDLIDNKLHVKNYLDLSGTYDLPLEKQKVTLRFGISNLLGTNPQTVSSNAPNAVSGPPFGNGNTYPNVYDPLGRTLFVGVQADL
ncbi:MAG: TonB-dependent receptor [Nevskiaceae bacterium]|nr:MAG: TonB-dependent receptor [Nevskiaceae bacterium]